MGREFESRQRYLSSNINQWKGMTMAEPKKTPPAKKMANPKKLPTRKKDVPKTYFGLKKISYKSPKV